ncbi:hypothetical protein ACH4SK_34235 [Streptomyces inhibens]|uniref:hypothetical protein n=1 Tax=Streptomyces inhibens TaxID=2293571 RepID=UPI0037A2BD82
MAGVILHIAWVDLRLAVKKRAKGQLPRWQIVTAATAITLTAAFMIAHQVRTNPLKQEFPWESDAP